MADAHSVIHHVCQAQVDLTLTYDQSPLRPIALKGHPAPDQVFELSDNGRVHIRKDEKAYFDTVDKTVHVNLTNKRAINSPAFYNRVVVHEYAHRAHYVKDIITNASSDDDIKELMRDLKVITDKKGKKLADLAGKSTVDRYKIVDQMYEKFGFTYADTAEMSFFYFDTIQAITWGEYGAGHELGYYLKANGILRPAEVFAHAAENYFFGNPIFEYLDPELYDRMMVYFREKVIKKHLPNRIKWETPTK